MNIPYIPLLAKLGCTGVYLVFLFLIQNIDYGYRLELPRIGWNCLAEVVFNKYPQYIFCSKIKKISKNFSCVSKILCGQIFIMKKKNHYNGMGVINSFLR